MKARNRVRYYLGHVRGHFRKLELFSAATTPTLVTHGGRFFAVVGPFRVKWVAEWALENPGAWVCVSEAEELAKLARGKAKA